MNEKTKSVFRKVLVYIIVLALGIAIGIMSVKGTAEYKEMRSLKSGMTFRAYTVMMKLDNAFNKDLTYDEIYENIKELSFIMGLAGRSDNIFLNEADRELTVEEWAALYECSVKAKFIAYDLATGADVSYDDKKWLEDFGIAVKTGNRNPSEPSYKLFAECLIAQELYTPEETTK